MGRSTYNCEVLGSTPGKVTIHRPPTLNKLAHNRCKRHNVVKCHAVSEVGSADENCVWANKQSTGLLIESLNFWQQKLHRKPRYISVRASVRSKMCTPAHIAPQPKSSLVHFSFKIWDLVATILTIFQKINWLIWQILCSLYVCLCLEDWGLGPLGPLGYTTALSTQKCAERTIGQIGYRYRPTQKYYDTNLSITLITLNTEKTKTTENNQKNQKFSVVFT